MYMHRGGKLYHRIRDKVLNIHWAENSQEFLDLVRRYKIQELSVELGWLREGETLAATIFYYGFASNGYLPATVSYCERFPETGEFLVLPGEGEVARRDSLGPVLVTVPERMDLIKWHLPGIKVRWSPKSRRPGGGIRLYPEAAIKEAIELGYEPLSRPF